MRCTGVATSRLQKRHKRRSKPPSCSIAATSTLQKRSQRVQASMRSCKAFIFNLQQQAVRRDWTGREKQEFAYLPQNFWYTFSAFEQFWGVDLCCQLRQKSHAVFRRTTASRSRRKVDRKGTKQSFLSTRLFNKQNWNTIKKDKKNCYWTFLLNWVRTKKNWQQKKLYYIHIE